MSLTVISMRREELSSNRFNAASRDIQKPCHRATMPRFHVSGVKVAPSLRTAKGSKHR